MGYRGLEAEFAEHVEEAELAAQQAELPSPEPAPAKEGLVTELLPDISAAPRAAVIKAWQAVERELMEPAGRANVVLVAQPWTPKALVREMLAQGVIDSALASVIEELVDARNVAAHAHPYTVERDEVFDYVKLAGRVRTALRAIDPD